MIAIFKVFLQARARYLRIALEARLYIRDLLVRYVLFFQIVQNIAMMLSVEAKEHFWIVQVT